MTTMKTPSDPAKTALILGANGSIGAAVAQALDARGWRVKAMVRDPLKAQARWRGAAGAIEWMAGDAMVQADVVAAAQGARVLVHAVSPPGYRDWDKLVLPMIDNTIAAAKAAGGARIVLPGTIYNFDAARTPLIGETSPQHSGSRKGRIRAELERRLQQSSHAAPVLIVRAGDFYGPQLHSSWFAQAMITPGRPVTRVRNLAPGVGHAWAYLPDLAETMVRLLDHPQLRPFESVGFDGFWDHDGHQFPALIAAALGRNALPQTAFPWGLLRAASPFMRFAREALDILPYWRHPVRIDNTRLTELLGAEPRTPPVQAMCTTLQGLGCLPAQTGAPLMATQ